MYACEDGAVSPLEDGTPATPQDKHARYDASAKGHARRTAYKTSDKGKESKRKGRQRNSTWTTNAKYLSKPFIGWDGEGVTLPDGSHKYVLLANSLGSHIEDPDGLPMYRCLQFMLAEAGRNPGAIHVAYGAGYDINMILKGGLTYGELLTIYQNRNISTLRGFDFKWRRGKSLWFRAGDTSMTLWDCAPFFQVPFIKACDDYLGPDWHERELIIKNKALRSGFQLADLPEILRYNAAELVNLVDLMNELRERLNRVNLRPARWDGPGAIAASLLQREGIKASMAVSPEPVAQAARYAYAGGRFEVVRYGAVGDLSEPVWHAYADDPEGPSRRVLAPLPVAYEYDLNSAYPSALRHVPNLSRGQWLYWDHDPGPKPFALYHVEYKDPDRHINSPAPLFHRAAKGTISYPCAVTGWYWSPEIDALRAYWVKYDNKQASRILGAWVFEEDDPEDRPFDFIDRLYAKRRALKAGGDGAHTGIKLGLNSLYGKLAQQVGWEEAHDGKPLRIPPYHQLEWAGYTTSHCRANIMLATLHNRDAIIAYETDALFSSEPLPVDIGPDLGQWEVTEFSQLTYVQSGVYFGRLKDGTEVAKTRGVDRGSLTHADVLRGLGNFPAPEQRATATLTRFIGAGVALSQGFGKWGTWTTDPKTLNLVPMGKRTHIDTGEWCDACKGFSGPLRLNVWHQTYCERWWRLDHSAEFPLGWINPNPDMTEMDDIRERKYEQRADTEYSE